jgi:hypothetical protein
MVLQSLLPSGVMGVRNRFNGDSGTNYSRRNSWNGVESTSTNNSTLNLYSNANNAYPEFDVMHIANYATKEKLAMSHCINQNTTGSSTAPIRGESFGKWANTSNVINEISGVDQESGQMNTGSEIVVLGWDPADTHTTNFWEQLASVNGDGTGGFSSGTFTAKKYLWVQTWVDPSVSSRNLVRFNDDSGSNYSVRHSLNGSESTLTSQTSLDSNHTVPLPKFFNMFIVNNSANEKLLIEHSVYVANAGVGGTPQRTQIVGKWTNTSNQITKIDYIPSTGNYSTDSKMIVWGSN